MNGSSAYSLLIALLRLYRKLSRGRRDPGSTLILPPAPAGSLGDEALLTALVGQLRALRRGPLGIIAHGRGPGNAPPPAGTSNDELRIHALAGNLRKHRSGLWLALAAAAYENFYLIGADVLDGHYSEIDSLRRLRFASIAHDLGLTVKILSFSVKEDPACPVQDAFRKLPRPIELHPRDPASRDRLEAILGRPVSLSSDLAFLLEPAPESPALVRPLTWTRESRARGQIVIGVNLSASTRPRDNLLGSFVLTLQRLAACRPDVNWILIPHDYRRGAGGEGDREIAQALHEQVGESGRNRGCVLAETMTAAEVKRLCAELDGVVSGRMHLSIASLGQATPAASIPSQGKFEGLYRHLGLEDLILDPRDAREPDRLLHFILSLLERRTTIAAHLRRELPRIRSLALAPLQRSPGSERSRP